MRVRLRQIILTRILWIERTEVVFMEKPLVSVVMPVYNGERYIGKAIESALGQEVPVEVLVIDDCSADGTSFPTRERGLKSQQWYRFLLEYSRSPRGNVD